MLDIPEEIITGCGPEETFRSDYKAAVFPYTRSAHIPVIEPTPSIFKHEQISGPTDCYYFESDHLALKDNQDYLNMLETVITLQAQRTQAINDLETLLKEKKKALAMDPYLFIKKLQKGEFTYPGFQKIAEIPNIDWTKYHIFKPDQLFRPQTRHAGTEPISRSVQILEEKTQVKKVEKSFVKTKSQAWTCEEQQKLDKLLEKYPSEDNEMNRFRKISDELGTRTPTQVFSRCQKYFKKLQKKGLQIPGRLPKARSEMTKKVKRHKHGNNRPSTFFPYEQLMNFNPEPVENKLIKSEVTEDNLELRQVELLQKIKEEKSDDTDSHHFGFQCYICNDEPIKGIRWHCQECQHEEINLCSSCVIAQREAEEPLHPPTHRFKDLEAPKYSENYDIDYLPYKFNSKNYLDPNFILPH